MRASLPYALVVCMTVLAVGGCSKPLRAPSFAGKGEKHPIDLLAESKVTEERISAYRQLGNPGLLSPQDRVFALEELTKGVRSEYSPLSRMVCAEMLGAYADPQSIEALRLASSDKHPMVRRQACLALGTLKAATAVPLLGERAKDDADPDVRRAAVTSLVAMADPAADRHLVEVLKDRDLAVANAAHAALKQRTGQDIAADYTQWAAVIGKPTANLAAREPLAAGSAAPSPGSPPAAGFAAPPPPPQSFVR